MPSNFFGHLKRALELFISVFDVAIGTKIPFFRVLVTMKPGRSLLQFVTTNCLIVPVVIKQFVVTNCNKERPKIGGYLGPPPTLIIFPKSPVQNSEIAILFSVVEKSYNYVFDSPTVPVGGATSYKL